MKIALSGKMGSGKSFIADKIVIKYGFKKISFASRVKQIAEELFEMKDKNRGLLISLATKMREIDPLVWIKCVLRFCDKNQDCDIIIDDLRLLNEYETLKSDNWFIVKIDIDEKVRLERLESKYKFKFNDHKKYFDCISENDVVSLENDSFNFIIQNNSDINKFFEHIEEYIRT